MRLTLGVELAVAQRTEQLRPARIDGGGVFGITCLQLVNILGILPLEETRGMELRVRRLFRHGCT